jgi:ATP-dependent Lhr-like helicase
MDTEDLIVHATRKPARIPTYGGARMPISTNLADRVRHYFADPSQWPRFPGDVRDWLEMQGRRSALPHPDQLLIETFPREGRHYMVVYSFEGWNAHQSLGMLVTRRMETAGLKPLGFVASDYAIATYSLEPVTDPAPLFSREVLEDEFVDWVQQSSLLKRAFREVAVIGGLVERQHPGKRKTGRQVTFSTDLIYDVLRKHQPDHLLLRAARQDAATGLLDVRRLGMMLQRIRGRIIHKPLDRVSPLSVSVMLEIGRERVYSDNADEILAEAEAALLDEALA